MKGLVSLVGSGPGNPGLLTLQAKRRLEEADLIVYDYLANPAHLTWAKKKAVKICVGKGFRYKKMPQERINRLILNSSNQGKRVVRLKGGDPYLFGRGGEEALYLKKRRVPFEVVPGVTSATACAAYAGVPLTHRDHNASVTFLTGHRAGDTHLDSVPWTQITSLGGTIVIYMGIYNIGRIAEGLLKAGMKKSTPVCVVEWGTLPRQKSCEAPLETIVAIVKKAGLKAPCIIIIGEVVTLRKKLNWYERLPLFGKTFLVTRPAEKASRLAEKLEAEGGEVYSFSTIQIKSIDHFGKMDKAIQNLKKFHWIIFTSSYGVDAFFNRLDERFKRDARILSGVRVAGVGPETANALRKRGVRPDWMPGRYETKAIAGELQKKFCNLRGLNFLLPRTNIAPAGLENDLRKMGARVERITAYRTIPVKKMPAGVSGALLSGQMDFVTFASASAVTNFVKLLGRQKVQKIPKHTRFASIGPVTSKALRDFGLKAACEAKVFTIDGLVEALKHAST